VNDRLMVYIPKSKQHHKLIERLRKLTKQRDCSVNHLVLEAVEQFLERVEKNPRRK